MGKYDKFILKDTPKMKLVPFHNKEIPIWIDNEYMQDQFWVCLTSEGEKVVDFGDFVDLHKHPVPEIYLAVGEITLEVTFEDEKHLVDGNAVVYIPSGVAHKVKMVKATPGKNVFVAIVAKADYPGTTA